MKSNEFWNGTQNGESLRRFTGSRSCLRFDTILSEWKAYSAI